VSRQTVSRAINDKDDIDPATKERVLQAVRTLGYRPSRHARSLRRRDSLTLGLLVPDLTNPFFPEIASSVLQAARPQGWTVMVLETDHGEDSEIKALDMLALQADAIVGYCRSSDEVLARHAPGLPIVLLERQPSETRFGTVAFDMAGGMEQAVRHLVEAGHRRIGLIDGALRRHPSARREHFLDQVRSHKLEVGERDIAPCTRHSVVGGEAAMGDLLDAAPDVTAVVAFNDLIAVGAMRTARGRGLRIPEDMAVIGFDGLALGTLVEPSLTSLSLDKRQVGQLAVDQVVRMFVGEEPAAGDRAMIRPELVVRDSA
jgi:LacI family transcriptional regulator